MKFKPLLLLFILFSLGTAHLQAQKRGAVWCFGDSALVDFSDTSNIFTGRSAIKSRGSCVSISDSLGNLQLYGFTRANMGGESARIYNSQNFILPNGDSIAGEGWYHELVLLPFPENDSLFYLFSIGLTASSNPPGFYYSIINKNSNNGLGEVVQKNVLLQNFKTVDCLTAIKHGNGRDWWVIFRKSDYPSSGNADYYSYLVSPNGLSSVIVQTVGSTNTTNSGRITFNIFGNNMVFINARGLIESYDFDRCTGVISNPVTIHPEFSSGPYPYNWSAEFSPSGNVLYVQDIAETVADSSHLYQYDLLASNIANSRITLWATPWLITIDQLKRAPDNKIYFATNYKQIYPYADSMYNYINMNLSVINSPDSLGFACDVQPFSFSLGGARCYAGLPNNPDYDLPALSGSPCDTLLGVNELDATQNAELFVYYSSNWQTAFINAQKLKGREYTLEVFDLLGNEVFKEAGKLNPPYFNKNLYCTSFSKGMYVVVLQTEKEHLTSKFIIQ